VVADLDLEPYVDLFSGVYIGPASSKELASRCWDLDGLESQYQVFLDRYQPEYRRFLNYVSRQTELDAEECFSRRSWLTHDFQSFPLRDPNLPTMLLEPNWIGLLARNLFDDYRQLLEVHVDDFADKVICGDGYVYG
jgi:phenylacetic acid degradation operon negative regulatory protein